MYRYIYFPRLHLVSMKIKEKNNSAILNAIQDKFYWIKKRIKFLRNESNKMQNNFILTHTPYFGSLCEIRIELEISL